jgi:hypothetical protein
MCALASPPPTCLPVPPLLTACRCHRQRAHASNVPTTQLHVLTSEAFTRLFACPVTSPACRCHRQHAHASNVPTTQLHVLTSKAFTRLFACPVTVNCLQTPSAASTCCPSSRLLVTGALRQSTIRRWTPS